LSSIKTIPFFAYACLEEPNPTTLNVTLLPSLCKSRLLVRSLKAASGTLTSIYAGSCGEFVHTLILFLDSAALHHYAVHHLSDRFFGGMSIDLLLKKQKICL
jgi:hypothetical protein